MEKVGRKSIAEIEVSEREKKLDNLIKELANLLTVVLVRFFFCDGTVKKYINEPKNGAYRMLINCDM